MIHRRFEEHMPKIHDYEENRNPVTRANPSAYECDEYLAYVEAQIGHCLACDKPSESVHGRVLPHEAGLECGSCHAKAVISLTRGMLEGVITVTEIDPRGDVDHG